MTLQAHYTEQISASLEMNIYTAMFTVKVRKEGDMVKQMFDAYDAALQFYQNQINERPNP